MSIAGFRVPPILLALLAALVGYLAAVKGFRLPGVPLPAAAA